MTKKAKTFKTGISLEPLSADPDSPKEGQLQISDGNHREKGLWIYEDGAWKEASVDSFLDFPDTPSDYTGNANKFAKVNLSEDAIEFTDVTSNYDYGTYTPTFGGGFGGNPVTGSATWMQIGNMLHIQGKVTTQTPAPNEAQVGLPPGFTIKTGQTVRVVGHAVKSATTTPYTALLNVLATGDDDFLNFSYTDGNVGGAPLEAGDGSFLADATIDISFHAFVEVNEALASNLSGGFVNNFLSITDTPNDYTGQAGKVATVKGTEDGIEFTPIPDTFNGISVGSQVTHAESPDSALNGGLGPIRRMGSTAAVSGGGAVTANGPQTYGSTLGKTYLVEVEAWAQNCGDHYLEVRDAFDINNSSSFLAPGGYMKSTSNTSAVGSNAPSKVTMTFIWNGEPIRFYHPVEFDATATYDVGTPYPHASINPSQPRNAYIKVTELS